MINFKLSHILYKTYLLMYRICPIKLLFIKFLKCINYNTKSKLVSDLYYKGSFTVKTSCTKFKLFSERDDKSAFHYLLYGINNSWDACSIRLWEILSTKSHLILDVGTNIGLYALSAKAINPAAKVIGFEPSLNAYQKVKKNIEINKFDIEVEKIALSNFIGNATFYDSSKHTAIGSLISDSSIKNSPDLISYNVDVVTLDAYVQQNNLNKIDLISIDVEENEANVLKGMEQLLKKYQPTLIIEILNNKVGEDCYNILKAFNYMYYFIDEKKHVLYNVSTITKPNELSEHSNNLLVIKEDLFASCGLDTFLS